MDHTILRDSRHAELAAYLRQAAARTNTKAVTEELLSAVAIGSIPPRVFNIWLSASHDAEVVHDAIHQDLSRVIRSAGIKLLGRLFCGPRLDEAWKAMGGTPGILSILSLVSVRDVKTFCYEIGRGGTVVLERPLRQRHADELFKALCHEHFPETEFRTGDTRPLFALYQDLLPACSPELVVRHIDSKVASFEYRTDLRLLQAHSSVYRDKFFSKTVGQDTGWSFSYALFENQSTDTPTKQDPRISTNMLFTIRLLQSLSQGIETDKFSHHVFERYLVTALLRKISRRRCKPEVLQEVVRMIVSYARRQGSGMGRRLSGLSKEDPLWSLVRRWVRYPDQLETSLVDFLSILNVDSFFQGQKLVRLIESVPLTMRWTLLSTLIRTLPDDPVDLTSDEDLQRFNERWPVTLLMALPSSHARQLLERLIRLKPDGKFIIWAWYPGKARSKISKKHVSLDHDDDPTCLKILLSRDRPDCLELAKSAIEEARKEATTSREQSDRVAWVRKALDCAVASGSLDIYHRTLSWARRYKKDQNTMRHIYSESSLHTIQALDILCGFPEDCDISNVTVEDVRGNVVLGNQVCRDLFTQACMAQKEPDFYQAHWDPVMKLLEAVTRLRLARVNQLQDSLSLSDEEIFNLVWKDTLDTCLTLEKSGLEDEQSKLGFNTIGGPLLREEEEVDDIAQPRPPALKFIDDLARERNKLWEVYRARHNPSTVTLPALYPRGLPLQYLLPVDVEDWREGFDLPYLRQRAEAVVFMDPHSALSQPSKDEESHNAVGIFVENYPTAVRLYVSAYPIREQQALAAWKHATGPLSTPRMSSVEAFVYWKDVLKNAFERLKVNGPWSYSYLESLPEPELPLTQHVDPDGPVEWNPDPEAALYEVKARNLEVTMLDEMIDNLRTCNCDIDTGGMGSFPAVDGIAIQPLWERFTTPQMSPKVQEALIAAGLLHLNGKRCDSHRLLMSPFPSSSVVRFPALLLDDEFLDRKNLDDMESLITCLQRLDDVIPPTLLFELVKAMFAELEAKPNNVKLAHDAFAMLKLLSKTDRPELALDMIIGVILDRPDDSAWHRAILTSALLETLPAAKAKAFSEVMAHSIQMRLHGRPARTSGAESTAKLARLPAVKVTSVKMLAQLMAHAEFIDEATSVRILDGLIINASHLDMRVAAVQSLIQVFTGCADGKVKDSILKVLEEHAVPIAGSLSERVQMKEQNWAQAESALESIPEVYMESNDQNPGPILSALLEAVKSPKMPTEDRNDFIARLLVPAFQLSAQVNRRWMTLFVKCLDEPSLDLPQVPVKPLFLTRMFEHPSHVPAWATKAWLDMFAIDLDPPPAVAQITTRVREDVALRNSNAGKHWLSTWKQRDTTVNLNRATLTKLLTQEWQMAIADGIDYPQLQDLILKQADVLLKTADEKFLNWNPFVAGLQLPPHSSPHNQPHWYKHCKPVVQRLIQHVDGQRTTAWQNDAYRFPSVLPSTFGMRLWLLSYPHVPSSTHDTDVQVLAAEVSQLLDQLARSATPYWSQYDQVESTLNNGVARKTTLTIAFILGDLGFLRDREPHLADLLRVKMAATMLKNNDSVIPQMKSEVLALLQSWRRCRVEEIRMLALTKADGLRSQGLEWVVL